MALLNAEGLAKTVVCFLLPVAATVWLNRSRTTEYVERQKSIPNKPVPADNKAPTRLKSSPYAEHKKIHPRHVTGLFRQYAKWQSPSADPCCFRLSPGSIWNGRQGGAV